MKKSGILHPCLNQLLSKTGHTDLITVCDRGFPVPMELERIDLALVAGIPTVVDVLQAIDAEFIIDTIILTHEMAEASPERYAYLTEHYPHIHFKRVSHQEFKQLCLESRAVVRTGDAVPYANIILVSG